MRAGLIVLGGLRTFVGRVRSIDALTENVEVTDVHRAGLYRILPFQPKQVYESAVRGKRVNAAFAELRRLT